MELAQILVVLIIIEYFVDITTQEGATDRRVFGYNPKAISGDYRNPVLMPGDVVRVNESLVSASLEFLNEITAPAVGLYSVYSIYRDIQQ